ncbi:hypothetical protein [Microcoleus vaginatus]|uniref:hypothetical protein n=1 Tax=Microcoleus vaginatus TaxID=119532 RepID=UPI001F600C5F
MSRNLLSLQGGANVARRSGFICAKTHPYSILWILTLLRLPNRMASIQILVVCQFIQDRTIAINYIQVAFFSLDFVKYKSDLLAVTRPS